MDNRAQVDHVKTPISIEVLDAVRAGYWNWEIDDLSTPIPSIYTVRVNRTALDQTEEIEIHLALPGDDSVRWFSDCGDPLP